MKRATYRGVGLFANGKQLNRVTAFGATGTLSKEEVFELGNSKIIEIVEDSPDVAMTIDANEYGSLDTIKHLAGLDEIPSTGIKFSEVFENANVPIWNYVKENATAADKDSYAQLMIGAVLTNYSANFSIDGNSTESFSLNADNKYWLRGDGVRARKVNLTYSSEDKTWKFSGTTGSYTTHSVIAVVYNKRTLSSSEYEIETELPSVDIEIKITDSTALDKAYAVVVGKYLSPENKYEFTEVKPDDDTFTNTIKRRGHIEVCLYNGEEEIKVTPAQSVSIDASLSREDIPALGFKRFYDRPLALPIDVTASIDVIFTDLDLFAELVGADSDEDVLSLDDFRNDLGLRVKIYDRTDVDPESTESERKPVKILEIPQIIPSDEAWNISLDGQATQTFSFRGMELIIKKGSE